MKRFLQVLIIYTAVAFVLCVGGSYIFGHLPELLDKQRASFPFLRGLLWFLTILPAILISGFVIGGSIQWRDSSSEKFASFSQQMSKRFKTVMLISIVLMLILTLTSSICIPGLKQKINRARKNPQLLQNYLCLGNKALEENEAFLAWKYACQANEIYRENEEVASLVKRAADAREIALASHTVKDEPEIITKLEKPIEDKNKSFTIRQMVLKSKEFAAEKDWFNAHYWANLAVEACSGTDTNLQEAKNCANNAWNHLSSPERFRDEAEEKKYKLKQTGYSALISGDYLKAYYIFNDLKKNMGEHETDPDVSNYLALAEEQLNSAYFFMDETEDFQEEEIQRDVYFSKAHSDGSFDVFYIKGVCTLKQADRMIRYLEGLNIFSYAPDKMLEKHMYVPYAKMLEVSSGLFSKDELKALGIPDKSKTVPYVILQSVDRNTEGIVCKPVYDYEPTGVPEALAEKFADKLKLSVLQDNFAVTGKNASVSAVKASDENKMNIVFPMPYSDFGLLVSASGGSEEMSIPELFRFTSKARSYGYAYEVFSADLVMRCVYPLFLLVLLIFGASFAWNYRLVDSKIFKFWWLLLFPLFTFVVLVVLTVAKFLFSVVNFLFVGFAGIYALPLVFVLYVIILIIVSINFLSRRIS